MGLKKNNITYIVHDNLRGDIVSVTDTSGNIVAQYHFDPWGNQISYSGTVSQPIRYAGYYLDDETGLYYLQSRYYSPALGRFLTRDEIDYVDYSDPQTLNLYSYARNNPVSFTDPDGTSILGIVINVIISIVNNLTSDTTGTHSGSSSSSDQQVVAASVVVRPGTSTALIDSGILTGVVTGVLYLDHVVGEWAHDVVAGLYNAGKGGTVREGPMGKPGLKEQGREVNEKKRKGKTWVKNPNKNPDRPMKPHTPGRGHRGNK